MAAIHIGQRKNPVMLSAEDHGLVARRVENVSAFADGVIPTQPPRPTVVGPPEPSGIEMQPGYNMEYEHDGSLEVHPGYQFHEV